MRKCDIFRVAVIGMLGSLLIAGCSTDANAPRTAAPAPRSATKEQREFPAPLSLPKDANLSHRKSANITGGTAGGLEAPEPGSTLSDNLLVNGDFVRGLEGWHAPAPCFQPDSSTRAPNGKPSLKIENPESCAPSANQAVNEFVAPPGIYSIGGEIKTSVLSDQKKLVAGAQMDFFTHCQTTLKDDTGGWQKFEGKHCVVEPGTRAPFHLAINGNAVGPAWFANMYVREEIAPLVRIFMLYPNYRGYLFADQSQQLRAAVTMKPGPDLRREDLVFQLEAVGSDSGLKADQSYKSPADDFTATLDFGPLPAGVYQVSGRLLSSNGTVLFEPPPYRVVKVSSNASALMKAWIDQNNLAHFGDGNPHFVIGIYDTSGYSSLAQTYAPALDEISQAPINMMVNYLITSASVGAINAYTYALQQHGIFLLPTVNNFYEDNKQYPHGLATSLGAATEDDFIARYANALAGNRAVAGYYVQDEPEVDKVARTFHQYQIIKANDPAGFNFMVLDHPSDVQFWRDAVDVAGVDPYPVWLPDDNSIGEVGDWTRTAVEAVHASRPVWTVIQFFQADAMASWPTEQQLHDMTWMAIAEGATGVFYWSHGMRGLGWVRNPGEKTALWKSLVHVTKEIKDLEPVLLRPDTKVLLEKPSENIVTREKTAPDGTRYVIAYNQSIATSPARFVLQSPAQSVTIRRSAAKIEIKNATTFNDNFAGYEAKVYEIH